MAQLHLLASQTVVMPRPADPAAAGSAVHSVSHDGVTNTHSKVYYSPKLTYLKVVAISAQNLVPAKGRRPLATTIVKMQLGGQIRRTRPGQPQGSANPTWNEEFMFVSGEPFEDPLVVTVEERLGPGRDEPMGCVIIPVAALYATWNDLPKPVPSKWFSMSLGLTVDEAAVDVTDKEESRTFLGKIHLRLSIETAYHVLDELAHSAADRTESLSLSSCD